MQAFKNHNLHDPLVDPGTADLTADVDFSYLKNMVSDDDGRCLGFCLILLIIITNMGAQLLHVQKTHHYFSESEIA